MAFDAFLKVSSVEGESPERGHKRWIEILAFNFGGNTMGAGDVGGGLVGGKVSMQDFHFTKRVDVSSPKLVEACCAGKIFDAADVELCRSTGQKQSFLKFHFDHVLVSSYSTGGSNGDGGLPVESISFNFVKCNVEYVTMDERGMPVGSLKAGYDVKQTKAI